MSSAGRTSASRAELAWPTGDRPGAPDFCHPVAPDVVDAIRHCLEPAFPPSRCLRVSLRALGPTEGAVGRYRLSVPEGEWFVRVSSRWGHPELEQALVNHLASRGVAVAPLVVAGVVLEWAGRTARLDVRPFVEGRHYAGAPDDLREVAQTLSACHRALRAFAGADEVRARAGERSRRLAAVREDLASALAADDFSAFGPHEEWARSERDWLATMVEGYDPFPGRWPGAQSLHGQVHQANVLFRASDGVAVLIDFEEATHLVAPPAWDLAFLAQRFALADEPPPAVAAERVLAITRAYGPPAGSLVPFMRQAAWYSMAVIVDLALEGVLTARSECEKFVRLERQACSLAGVV